MSGLSQQDLGAMLIVKGGSVSRIAEAAGVTEAEVLAAVEALQQSLEAADVGMVLLRDHRKLRLAATPGSEDLVRRWVGLRRRKELSREAKETLVLLLRRGPMTAREVAEVRGVENAYAILTSLVRRHLVERSSRGRPGYELTPKGHGVLSVKGLPPTEREISLP